MKIIETNLKFHGSLSKRSKTDMIILHHAEASKCSVEDIHRWHLNFGWSGFGYHFLVRKDGSIYRGRPELTIGAHCSGNNSTSIGICAEGDYMKETMPEVQKAAIIQLIHYLKNKYKINNIYGHREVGSSNCPGINFPLEEIKQGRKKVDYCLEYQRWYNQVTQTKKPILEDGKYGPQTEKALDLICGLVRKSD